MEPKPRSGAPRPLPSALRTSRFIPNTKGLISDARNLPGSLIETSGTPYQHGNRASGLHLVEESGRASSDVDMGTRARSARGSDTQTLRHQRVVTGVIKEESSKPGGAILESWISIKRSTILRSSVTI